MDVRITVEPAFDNGKKRIHQLDGGSRPYRVTCPEGLGLRPKDGKRVAGQIQQASLCDQVKPITRESRVCPACSPVRAIHDCRTRNLDTFFGRVSVKAARLRRCSCNAKGGGGPKRAAFPIGFFFPDRAAPEFQRPHARLGSRNFFRKAARLLTCLLPCQPPQHTTVRGRLGLTADRLERSRSRLAPVTRVYRQSGAVSAACTKPPFGAVARQGKGRGHLPAGADARLRPPPD